MSGETTHTGRRRGRTQREMEPPQAIPEVFPTALVEEEGQKEELRFVPGVEATKRVSRTSESDSRSSNNGDMAGGKDSHIPRRESVTSEELLGEAAELHPHGDEFDDLQVLDITGGLDDDLESARHVVEKGQSKAKLVDVEEEDKRVSFHAPKERKDTQRTTKPGTEPRGEGEGRRHGDEEGRGREDTLRQDSRKGDSVNSKETPPKEKEEERGLRKKNISPIVFERNGSHTEKESSNKLREKKDAGKSTPTWGKYNHENIDLAKEKNVWSTPPYNEKKLNKAFRECKNVLLIFSVRESGRFQGYARLASDSRHDGPKVPWILPSGISHAQLGGVFNLDWIHKGALEFQLCQDLKNPWNDNKPVKISRDGQEVEPLVGEKLCRLWVNVPDDLEEGGASGHFSSGSHASSHSVPAYPPRHHHHVPSYPTPFPPLPCVSHGSLHGSASNASVPVGRSRSKVRNTAERGRGLVWPTPSSPHAPSVVRGTSATTLSASSSKNQCSSTSSSSSSSSSFL
eukprot:Em0011g985a